MAACLHGWFVKVTANLWGGDTGSVGLLCGCYAFIREVIAVTHQVRASESLQSVCSHWCACGSMTDFAWSVLLLPKQVRRCWKQGAAATKKQLQLSREKIQLQHSICNCLGKSYSYEKVTATFWGKIQLRKSNCNFRGESYSY